MRSASAILALLLFSFYASNLTYAQAVPGSQAAGVIKQDVNKDGKADVTYHHDGQYITKAEADTNYDGKADVTVHTKDGKFASAEADTDHDGKADKKFNDATEFNKWLNENNPDFNDALNKTDWRVPLMKF